MRIISFVLPSTWAWEIINCHHSLKTHKIFKSYLHQKTKNEISHHSINSLTKLDQPLSTSRFLTKPTTNTKIYLKNVFVTIETFSDCKVDKSILQFICWALYCASYGTFLWVTGHSDLWSWTWDLRHISFILFITKCSKNSPTSYFWTWGKNSTPKHFRQYYK